LRRRQAGQAVVEAVMVLPILLSLVVGVLVVGTLGRTDQAVLSVAQEAARAGATAETAGSAVEHGQERGRAVAAGYRLEMNQLQLNVDAGNFDRGGSVRVDASYTLALGPVPLFGQPHVLLKHSHTEPVDQWRNLPS
jgi:Flp pilus assembly protein TadG